jgi:DNA polymerase IV
MIGVNWLAIIEHLFYYDAMRIACVDITHFYVQVALKEHPWLQGRPVVIGGMSGERAFVVDCSEEAAARGVTRATTLEEAARRCPGAAFLSLETGRYEGVWEEILSTLASFTLRIEAAQPGAAFLDITKALKVWKTEGLIADGMVRAISSMFHLSVHVGIGNSRFVAREAARSASLHAAIVPPGGEQRFVAPLSIEYLPVPGDVKERLALLGLRTLKKIGALSRGQLVSQFGSIGETMWGLAQGAGDREGIRPGCAVTSVERETVCEPPLETMEHLAAPLATTVEGLVAELNGLGRQCRKVRLVLTLDNGGVFARDSVLHRPTVSADEIQRRILSTMESVTFGSPIVGILLVASALSCREEKQEGLFRGLSNRPGSFGAIRGFLVAKYGQMPVVRIEEQQEGTYLPEKKFLFVAL